MKNPLAVTVAVLCGLSLMTSVGLAASPGQREALEAAKSYLSLGSFSRTGLIEQLSSEYGEGFTRAEAVWAVNHVKANWKAEAVEAARSYLKTGSFSRAGLIDQLSSPYGEGFTRAQAVYAVSVAYR